MLCRRIGTWPARGRAWSAGRWILATRRTYTNAGTDGSPANDAITIPKAWHGKGPQAVMGSVTTETAQKTSIEDLLNGIRPQRAQDQDGQGKSALLALLLTPSYASDALKSDLPLSVLKRLHDEDLSNLSWPLDVVTAVVDRIPSKKDLKGGHEGLAYMLQHNAEPLDTAAQIPLSPSAQKPGSISFELPATTERPQDYTVQLPLAHTVFFSGMVSTLVHSRYTSDNGTPVMQSQRNLERETLSVPLTAQYNKYHQNVPLIPLTPFRTVRHHMGNIIRTLSPPTGPGVPDEEVPPEQAASTELEAAVTGYFEARSIQPEPVNVWAVIVPDAFAKISRKDHKAQRSMRRLTKGAITRFWKGEDLFKSINPYLMNTMRINGARLVKVLSGGGGWGKKAGLLSLDPDSIYSNRELRNDDGWKFNFEDESDDAAEKQQKEALGEIVKEGEHIMFMLGPADMGGAAYGHAEAKRVVDQADRAALFGVIPSSIDSIPTEQTDSDSAHSVSLEQNFFGALSEGGMAVTIKQSGMPDLQSKVDVPYSHIRLTERVSYSEQLARDLLKRTQHIERRIQQRLHQEQEALHYSQRQEQKARRVERRNQQNEEEARRIEQQNQQRKERKLAKARKTEETVSSETLFRQTGHDGPRLGTAEVRGGRTKLRSIYEREKRQDGSQPGMDEARGTGFRSIYGREKRHDGPQPGRDESLGGRTEFRSIYGREGAREAGNQREKEASDRLEEARTIQSHEDTAHDDFFWRQAAESTEEAPNANKGHQKLDSRSRGE
ncbi:hypothetical protein KC363_g2110 [Hortaea werneckii]|nr:hypothetical protein KC363_g2110 [Hortaea werneckii]